MAELEADGSDDVVCGFNKYFLPVPRFSALLQTDEVAFMPDPDVVVSGQPAAN